MLLYYSASTRKNAKCLNVSKQYLIGKQHYRIMALIIINVQICRILQCPVLICITKANISSYTCYTYSNNETKVLSSAVMFR